MTRESLSLMAGNRKKDCIKESALAVIDCAGAQIKHLLLDCAKDLGDLPQTKFATKEGLEIMLEKGIIIHTLFPHTAVPEYIVLLNDGIYHMRSKYVAGEPYPVFDSRLESHRHYVDYWHNALLVLPTKK